MFNENKCQLKIPIVESWFNIGRRFRIAIECLQIKPNNEASRNILMFLSQM